MRDLLTDSAPTPFAALNEYVPATAIVKIHGVSETRDEVVAAYLASLDARATIASLQAQMRLARAHRDTVDDVRKKRDGGLSAWVATEFGDAGEAASAFGIKPKKRAVRSAESQVHAKAQAKATRLARGTMGKRQRERIRGVVVSEPQTRDGA